MWQRFHRVFNMQNSLVLACVVVTAGFGTRSEFVTHTEVLELNSGSVILRPLPGTLHALPWAADGKYRIGEVLCESYWIPPYHDGAHQGACTRYIAKKQLDRLSALGYRFLSGYEVECFMFRKDGEGEVTSRPMFHGDDIYTNVLLAENEELICFMAEQMSAAGVDIVSMHPECASGLLEFSTGPKFGIESADDLFTLKEALKEMSDQRGWQVTFMSQPLSEPGYCSRMHSNGSLWIGDKNAFYDPETRGLSAIFRHWAAGLIKHAGALTALLCPTVNCYRGLHTEFAPSYADWGLENRNSMLRVVMTSPRTTYIENRLPTCAANPYVVMAATVAAGIDGLVNRLEVPVDTKEKLVSTLPEALEALEADQVMCEALGEEFIRWFLAVKREAEIHKVIKAKKDGQDEIEVERELYFKFI